MKADYIPLSDYIEYLQSEGQYTFTRQKVIESLNLTNTAFSKASYRLIKKGKLARIRGDFFIIIPAEYRAMRALPASWFIDAFMRHLNQAYYVALLSAASLHEAAHQQPMVFQVVTDKLTRPIIVGRVRIQFYYKKNIHHNFYDPTKTASGKMNVSTPEITAFDLIRYMNAAGQINNVATILCELAQKLNPSILAELVSNNEVEISVAQRLGYLLDILSLDIDLDPLAEIVKQRKATRRLLITESKKPVIDHNYRWSILVNEKVEPDEL